MSETRHPRLDIPGELLRSLYLVEMLSYVDLQKRFRMNSSTCRATLDHYGIPRRKRGPRSPEHHGSWTGGRVIDKHGYVLIHTPDHPHASKSGYVREHRLVMEKKLGRLLLPDEVVHHKDADPRNNAIENLQLFSKNAEHLRHELIGRVPNWTRNGKARIDAANRIQLPEGTDLKDLYWDQGISTKELGKRFGCSSSAIRNELCRQGIAVKTNSQSHAKLNLPPDDVLREMLAKEPTAVVAAKLGVKIGGLYAYLQRRGIPTSRKQGLFPPHCTAGYSPTRRQPTEPDAQAS